MLSSPRALPPAPAHHASPAGAVKSCCGPFKMGENQDRRFLAQCSQNLSSANLAGLLDLLILRFPDQVVERKGGDSYHIDFGILSNEAYALASKFIKDALKDDEESLQPLVISRQHSLASLPYRQDSITSLPVLPSPITLRSSVENVLEESRTETERPRRRKSGDVSEATEATPELPLPSANGHDQGTIASMSVSPEKKSSRLKRQRRSSTSPEEESEHQTKKEESRYYNGERVWRHATLDKPFSFHGVNVMLLSQQAETTKPWVCTQCSKTFVSKDKIVNHVQQHSGEKMHECPICHGKFSSKHYLKEHQKRVHEFDCLQCHTVFSSFEQLHDHSLKVHPRLEAKPCSCKKGCDNSRCTCFKNGLNCTSSCQCSNCNNMG